MSELEEVSFWPGSADGSYSRVGSATVKVITCRRRTALIVAAVVALCFIIAVSIPAGMLQHLKNTNGADSADSAKVKQSTGAPTAAPTGSPTKGPTKGPTVAPTEAPTPQLEPLWDDYRLPGNISVNKEIINITLNMEGTETSANNITYDGFVVLELKVESTTDRIILHAADMNIAKVEVKVGYEEDDPYHDVSANATLVHVYEQLQIKLPQNYESGKKLQLKITFNTRLRKDLHGFYASSYKSNPSMVKADRVIATTQFESTYARLAFPCFDEPDFKTIFQFIVIRPKSLGSLSNLEVESNQNIDNTTYKDTYGYTPKMSSYLVAFIISDFGKTEKLTIKSAIDNHTIDITVHGRKEQMSQFEFARNVTAKILTVYENFFQISYPFRKLDIVAIPDFEAGAMENWGLVTFRESALLYDPATSSSGHQQYVALVIAHELAHQWFGNYVTMKWWNEIWLNEGFATFIGQLVGTLAVSEDPDDNYNWPVVENYRRDVAWASTIDSLHSSHALSRSVESVNDNSEIMSMFDLISYEKGSAVIHMLDTYVTRDVTKAALQDYLSSHAYSNAEASDLWQSFDKAYNNTHPEVDDDFISNMMHSWTTLSGQPVLSVEIGDDDKIMVTQKQFFLCKMCNITEEEKNRTWIVPIQYKYSNGTHVVDGEYMLEGKEGTFDAPNVDWIKLNTDWNGFYLVIQTDLNRINITVLSDADVASLVEDGLQLFRAGHVSPSEYVKLLDRVMKEPYTSTGTGRGYLATKIVLKSWQFLMDIFDQRYDSYSQVSGGVYKWLDVANLNVSYEVLTAMDVKERGILSSKLSMALAIDHSDVLLKNPVFKDLTAAWEQSLLDATPLPDKLVHKDIALQVGKCAFLSDETGTWPNLWLKYKKSIVPSEQSDLEQILTSSNDVAVLLRILDMSLNEEKIERDESVKIINYVMGSRRGRVIGWDFIRGHWDVLYERYSTSGVSRLIKTATSYFSDDQRLTEMRMFFKNNKLGTGERASKQAIEKVMANIYLMKENADLLLNAILESYADKA